MIKSSTRAPTGFPDMRVDCLASGAIAAEFGGGRKCKKKKKRRDGIPQDWVVVVVVMGGGGAEGVLGMGAGEDERFEA